jgi:hypothetical protein
MTAQPSLFDILDKPVACDLELFAYTPSCGNWPGCERYVYRGAGTSGRCWCCSPDDDEALCAWCVGHDAWVAQQHEIGRQVMRAENEAYWAAPFHARFKRSETDGRTLFGLIGTYGSSWAAIEAIVANRDGLRWDFDHCIPTLIVWNTSTSAAFGLAHESIAQADRMLSARPWLAGRFVE